MNSESTAQGPFEQSAPTRDWLTAGAHHHERDMTWGIAIGLSAFALLMWGVATMGMVHPILAQIAACLGVK